MYATKRYPRDPESANTHLVASLRFLQDTVGRLQRLTDQSRVRYGLFASHMPNQESTIYFSLVLYLSSFAQQLRRAHGGSATDSAGSLIRLRPAVVNRRDVHAADVEPRFFDGKGGSSAWSPTLSRAGTCEPTVYTPSRRIFLPVAPLFMQ
jgi:hypothetical protein